MIRLIGIVAITLTLDRLSKSMVLHYMAYGESIPVFPFFHLTFVTNTGTAFGLFQNNNVLLFLVSSVILVVLGWMSRSLIKEEPRIAPIGLGLIMGGAIGNLWDRVQYHAVIDFLDFRIWPVFNWADSSITIGTLLLIFFTQRRKHVSHPN